MIIITIVDGWPAAGYAVVAPGTLSEENLHAIACRALEYNAEDIEVVGDEVIFTEHGKVYARITEGDEIPELIRSSQRRGLAEAISTMSVDSFLPALEMKVEEVPSAIADQRQAAADLTEK